MKKIQSARSKPNGIVFYSTRIPAMGIDVTIEPDGKINAEPSVVVFEDVLNFFGGGLLSDYKLNKWVTLLLDLILIAVAVTLKNVWYISAAIFFSIFASHKLYQSLVYCYAMKFGKLKSLARFHAAEHMAVNAYNAKGTIPTMEDLKNASRLSNACGSRPLLEGWFVPTVISLELITLGPMGGWLYFFALAITFAVLKLMKGELLFLQYMVTNSAEDTELKVALEGLKAYEEMEDSFESDCTCGLRFRCVIIEE